eukprot:PhF_6_TR934/c0_g1_i4/m.1657
MEFKANIRTLEPKQTCVTLYVLSLNEPELTALHKQLCSIGTVLRKGDVPPARQGQPSTLLLNIPELSSTFNTIEVLLGPIGPQHNCSRLNFWEWRPDGVLVLPSALQFCDLCHHCGVPYLKLEEPVLDVVTSAVWLHNVVEPRVKALEGTVSSQPFRLSVHTRCIKYKTAKVGTNNFEFLFIGKIEQGTVAVGDEVVTYPGLLWMKVTSVQVNYKPVSVAYAGQPVGIACTVSGNNTIAHIGKPKFILGPCRSGRCDLPPWNPNLRTRHYPFLQSTYFPQTPSYRFRMFVRIDRHTRPIIGTATGTVICRRGLGTCRITQVVENSLLKRHECCSDVTDLYDVQLAWYAFIDYGEHICLAVNGEYYGATVLPGEDVLLTSPGAQLSGVEETWLMRVVQDGSSLHPEEQPYYRVVGAMLLNTKDVELPETLPTNVVGFNVPGFKMITAGIFVSPEPLTEADEDRVDGMRGVFPTTFFAFEHNEDRWIVISNEEILHATQPLIMSLSSLQLKSLQKVVAKQTCHVDTYAVPYLSIQRKAEENPIDRLIVLASDCTKHQVTSTPNIHKVKPFPSREDQHGTAVRTWWSWSPDNITSILALTQQQDNPYLNLPRDMEAESVIPMIMSFCYPMNLEGYLEHGLIHYPPHYVTQRAYYYDHTPLSAIFPSIEKFHPRYEIDKERREVTASYHKHIPEHVPGDCRLVWKHDFKKLYIVDVPPGLPEWKLHLDRPFGNVNASGITVCTPNTRLQLRQDKKGLTASQIRTSFGRFSCRYLKVVYLLRVKAGYRTTSSRLVRKDGDTMLIEMDRNGFNNNIFSFSRCTVVSVYKDKDTWSMQPPPAREETCPECDYKHSVPDVSSIQVPCVHVISVTFPWANVVHQFDSDLPWWANPPIMRK